MSYQMSLRFDRMWEGYPRRRVDFGTESECGFVKNRCAANLSISLYAAKVIPELIRVETILHNFSNKQGVVPIINRGSSCRLSAEKMQLITGAETLAQFLISQQVFGYPTQWERKSETEEAFAQKVKLGTSGKKGIILFKDFWNRGNEPANNLTGDHIDLIKNGELVSTPSTPGSPSPLHAHAEKSKQVWLFE